MLKRLLGEPFKGQASVRALDEGDATGEHTSTNPQAHPTCQAWEGHSRPVPTGLPSPLPTGAQAQRSRWESVR